MSGGKPRMFRVESANMATIKQILVKHANSNAELHTDESKLYATLAGPSPTIRS